MAVMQIFDKSLRRGIPTLWAAVWFLMAIAAFILSIRAWPERMYTVVGGISLAMGLLGQGGYFLYLAISGREPESMQIAPRA